jgi:hypothetical protein
MGDPFMESGLLTRLLQRLQKTPVIHVILENRFTPISTVHHMVDGSRIFHP